MYVYMYTFTCICIYPVSDITPCLRPHPANTPPSIPPEVEPSSVRVKLFPFLNMLRRRWKVHLYWRFCVKNNNDETRINQRELGGLSAPR